MPPKTATLIRTLPRPLRSVLERLSGDDVLLLSAGVGFYALISLAPLVIVTFWAIGLIVGDGGVQRFADQMGKAAPKEMGIDALFEQVARRGTSQGVLALLTALWPASAYGSGLARAFERLSPGSKHAAGIRGRAFVLALLLPVFAIGGLGAAYLGTTLLEDGTLATAAGWALALALGFAVTGGAVALMYRVLPPRPLAASVVVRQAAIVAAGIALLSVGFVVFLSVGANFKDHYATSGIATVVLIGLWLFLSNALVLAGYRAALGRG